MFFWGKKRKIWPPGQIDPQRNTPTTETRFWMHWAKIHASQGKLWTHWRNQQKLKKARDGTSPICPPHPRSIFGSQRILHVLSDCGRNHTCQISSESFQGFRSPRWLKMTVPHWLGTSPLQQCNALTCYTVKRPKQKVYNDHYVYHTTKTGKIKKSDITLPHIAIISMLCSVNLCDIRIAWLTSHVAVNISVFAFYICCCVTVNIPVIYVCCFASVMRKQVNYHPHDPYGQNAHPLFVYQISSG